MPATATAPPELRASDSARVDKTADTPRYTQVKAILRERVKSGYYKPGDKIPAELSLAESLGVSKMTVNKAVLSLAAAGVLVREVGRGTFVAPGEPVPGAAAPVSARKIALSFVEGARDVLGSPYYGSIYRGVAACFDAQSAPVEMSIGAAFPAGADGLLIFAPRAEAVPVIERWWREEKRPLVVIGASWHDLAAPAVDSDNAGGASAAVRHLLERGHRRIVLLYAEAETANTRDRIAGYRDALARAGIPARPGDEVCAVRAGNAGEAAQRTLRERLTDAHEPATAIFAAGHYLALEALNAARVSSKRVPEDVSVIGFDDAPEAALVHPRLTVMRQPLFEMGRRAAERLLRLLHDRDGGTNRPTLELLSPVLVERDSVAPVAAER